MATEPLRLLQYAPLWGAPSLDPECTRVQAYLRFCGLLAGRDYVLEDCGPASIGELPVLAAEGVGLVSGGRIDACLCLLYPASTIPATIPRCWARTKTRCIRC